MFTRTVTLNKPQKSMRPTPNPQKQVRIGEHNPQKHILFGEFAVMWAVTGSS